MAISVVAPEMIISHRAFATKRAASGSGCSFESLMAGHIETVAVAPTESGERLDRVLAQRVALSRSRLKALILAGEVAIGGATIRDPGYRVNAGESVTVAVPPPESAAPEPEAIA